ncbi:MAG: hypothetical protein ACREPA_05805 [Candidatus Dormibacteraceae bacterium]
MLTAGIPVAVRASPPADVQYKETHDRATRQVQPAWMRAKEASKQGQAHAYWTSKLRHAAFGVSPNAAYNGNWLTENQETQVTCYYCADASVVEALGAIAAPHFHPITLGSTPTQAQNNAAWLLNTSPYCDNSHNGGTAWYGTNARVPSPTGYPVPDVLNYETFGNTRYAWYLPVALPYYTSSSDTSRFEQDLGFDIDRGWPLAGNLWEVPRGPHLDGHPGGEIQHWMEIRGYGGYGGWVFYEDSASGAEPMLGWYTHAPPYNSTDSNKFVEILGGRGYVW